MSNEIEFRHITPLGEHLVRDIRVSFVLSAIVRSPYLWHLRGPCKTGVMKAR